MRVVIVTESFPPDVNGVAHCALQTARPLARRGHTPLVTAPAVADPAADADAPRAVVRVPSLPLPGCPRVRVALPSRRIAVATAARRADLPGARFPGRRTGTGLARIFASPDVFVRTGPYETFCRTVQEAMASGVPVVAPAAGGPLNLVDHGRTGLLVAPGDPDALRGAVAAPAAAPGTRAALGPAGRAAVEGRTGEALGGEPTGPYLEVLRERTAVAA
ncbi:hypothetical protein GCM10010275_59970 [Streptomyces litmocidini]|uniref:glycosyltransferase n=1 Tax=Streptomyces litmocidini TaxID=67318 RepID=UPI00167D6234|nr:glycosyltransferase [Streptomyces litmocidini]GGV10963.1 hypothetical protein GCM10010275_59970 [Streptomyces litmocidini]